MSWLRNAALVGLAISSLAVAQTPQPGGDTGMPKPPTFSIRILPARESIQPDKPLDIAIEAKITPGWHVYYPIILEAGGAPQFEFQTAEGVEFGPIRYPELHAGEMSGLPYLGYDGSLVVVTSVTVSEAAAAKLTNPLPLSLNVGAIACQDKGFCIPVNATTSATIPISPSEGKPANESVIKPAVDALLKPWDKAPYVEGSTFTISQSALKIGDKAELLAKIRIKAGHHIGDVNPGGDSMIGSKLYIEKIDGIEIGEVVWPEPKIQDVPGVGKLRKQAGEITLRAPITITDSLFRKGPVHLRAMFTYQCCTDAGICYPPAAAEATLTFAADTPNEAVDSRYGHGTLYPNVIAKPAGAIGAASGTHSEATVDASGGAGTVSAATAVEPVTVRGVIFAILAGFLGGLILNIMPCVLPVLSLKILGFVASANQDPARTFRLGLTFSAGVLTWFWLFMILQSRSYIVLQDPLVVIALAGVLVLMALNLFGVFEIALPGAVATKLDQTAAKQGYAGAFWKGFLATLLGTACSAPFLVGALAYTASTPFIIDFAIYTSAGLGMAAPFLILSANPHWLRFVPKPGPWMITFKQAAGFVLLGTVVWLVQTLSVQAGLQGIVATLGFFTALALAVFIIGKSAHGRKHSTRLTGWGSAAAIAVFAWWVSFHQFYDLFGERARSHEPKQTDQVDREEIAGILRGLRADIAEELKSTGGASEEFQRIDKLIAEAVETAKDPLAMRARSAIRRVAAADWGTHIPWQPYSKGLADRLATMGYTVYVDYTAVWCANCKANAAIALEIDSTRNLMRELGVIPLLADFSKPDRDIAADLAAFKHSGVPMNLVYAASNPAGIIVLPIALTPGAVQDALRKAGASTGSELTHGPNAKVEVASQKPTR
jgi:thiol:disulfide interchange protein